MPKVFRRGIHRSNYTTQKSLMTEITLIHQTLHQHFGWNGARLRFLTLFLIGMINVTIARQQLLHKPFSFCPVLRLEPGSDLSPYHHSVNSERILTLDLKAIALTHLKVLEWWWARGALSILLELWSCLNYIRKLALHSAEILNSRNQHYHD